MFFKWQEFSFNSDNIECVYYEMNDLALEPKEGLHNVIVQLISGFRYMLHYDSEIECHEAINKVIAYINKNNLEK